MNDYNKVLLSKTALLIIYSIVLFLSHLFYYVYFQGVLFIDFIVFVSSSILLCFRDKEFAKEFIIFSVIFIISMAIFSISIFMIIKNTIFSMFFKELMLREDRQSLIGRHYFTIRGKQSKYIHYVHMKKEFNFLSIYANLSKIETDSNIIQDENSMNKVYIKGKALEYKGNNLYNVTNDFELKSDKINNEFDNYNNILLEVSRRKIFEASQLDSEMQKENFKNNIVLLPDDLV